MTDLLDRVRRSVERDWIQGSRGAYRVEEGPVCLVGAIDREWYLDRAERIDTQRFVRILADLVWEHYPEVREVTRGGIFEGFPEDVIVEFNDNGERTKDEVLHLIDLAKEKLRRDGMAWVDYPKEQDGTEA